jgi:hypothetical protein
MVFKVMPDPPPENGRGISLLLRCTSKDQFNRLNTSIARFLFEASSGQGTFNKLSARDQDYARDTLMAMDVDDVDMDAADDSSEEEEEEVPVGRASGKRPVVESESEEEEEDDEGATCSLLPSL